ncbi:hypothetical protein TanjilG_02892 [Lupinus angustifolius]|uniref:Uncharacterized protein n=1 Tax=Lupinus angustifolius TaxID=3871 RepID=A0A4P1QNU2_LUPAN|nr:hypothetical protein TanjilG_02892 [Lupinus angustifolius]
MIHLMHLINSRSDRAEKESKMLMNFVRFSMVHKYIPCAKLFRIPTRYDQPGSPLDWEHHPRKHRRYSFEEGVFTTQERAFIESRVMFPWATCPECKCLIGRKLGGYFVMLPSILVLQGYYPTPVPEDLPAGIIPSPAFDVPLPLIIMDSPSPPLM